MTKNFKDLISEYKITIPLIQRDYAQGRKDEFIKANNFLDSILKGTKEGLNLDFIYGKIEDNSNIKNFIPLDGQQRLTTLLLIHWFVSLENEYLQDLQNFNYEVRSSTKDFIKKLTSEISWKSFHKANIKASIENSNWFFLSWKNDPTVVAILNMLDLIEDKFTDIELNDLDNITFEFLNLNDFDLTDELYVKMNARGKPLTEFENFKSNFEKLLLFDDKEYEHVTKAKLDNEWLNIFWKIAKKRTKDISDAPKFADEMFYNFFYNITFNFYLEQNELKSNEYRKLFIYKKDKFVEQKKELDIKNLLKDKIYIVKNKEEIYTFNTITDFISNVSIFDFYICVYNNYENISKLITILDNIQINNDFETFISDKNISYWERAKFYALSLGYINNLNEIEFDKWKRVTYNLINNQLIQSPKNLIDSLQSLKKLSSIYQNNKTIYNHIADGKDHIQYFHMIQRDEESLKARLIIENKDWEKEFIEAEDHWYLNGQIGFLLKYSQSNTLYDLNEFVKYKNKFTQLWDFVINSKDNQILLYQALLTEGLYLPGETGKNYTFCSFDGTSVRVKNDNWRKVFNNDIKQKYLQNVLDNIDINVIKDSLNKIIHEWLNDKSECNVNNFEEQFRYTLISNSEHIKYCKNLQLRYYQNGKEVYLLSKNQMNSTHVELYTYDLYQNYFINKIFKPFANTKYFYTNSWETPCIVLDTCQYDMNSFEISIYFDFDTEKYEIYFNEINEKIISKQITNILYNENLKKEHDYQYVLKTNYGLCEQKDLSTLTKILIEKISSVII